MGRRNRPPTDPRARAAQDARQFETNARLQQHQMERQAIQTIIGQALERKALIEELLKNGHEVIEHLPEPDCEDMKTLLEDADDALNRQRAAITELLSQVLGLREPPKIEVPTTEECQAAEASKGKLEVVSS